MIRFVSTMKENGSDSSYRHAIRAKPGEFK
jgi:hypothetical protein